MKLEIVPAHELSIAEQARVFNEAFAGYLAGSMEMDAAAFARFLCAQGADLCYSRFVRETNGTLVSFGQINRTGNIPRLAAMGTIPSGRKMGAAAYLLSHLLDEAKTRGDEAMVLEVFEQNIPAVALYRRHGFRETTRLFGWRRKSEAGERIDYANKIEEISLLAASRMPSALEYPNLPWQVSRHAVLKLAAGRAFRLGDACVVVSSPEAQPIRVHAFFGTNQSELQEALAATVQKFPKTEFFAPPIFPETLQIFEPLGFVREPLNQFLMRREL